MVSLCNVFSLASAAESYRAAGLCVLPARLREKFPALTGWKPYQKALPPAERVAEWFGSPSTEAMCIVTGAVSGNVELLDFDCQGEVFDPWRELVEAEAPGLIDRLLIERSQSAGRHTVYRLDGSVSGSAKLAEKVCIAPSGEPVLYKGKKYVPRQANGRWEFHPALVETKGEGGLFLCAPSPGYVLEQGSFEELAVITAAEREILIRCARSFNERIEMAPAPILPSSSAASCSNGDRPGDDYNVRGDIRDLLTKHQWTCVRSGDNEYWRRPGKDSGWSATFNGRVFYNFSASAVPFEPDRGYSKFHVYTLLEHNGDYSAAAAALRAAGFGRPASPAAAPTGEQVTVQADYPDPLPLDSPKPPPMHCDMLDGWLGSMALRIAEATETPLELSALLCLSAVATACQGRFSVRPEPGYFEPVNIWTAPAMKSGQRKTAVHKLATRPLVDWEREQSKQVAGQRQAVESRIKTDQARVAKLRAKCAGEDDPAEQERLQQEIEKIEAAMPQLPALPRLFTQDVTPEHLGTMMAEQNERMAILSDEGGLFDILAGRYSSGIPNLDLFLQAHSGSAVRVDRGSRPSVLLNHPLLTMGLSPQPDVLRALNSKPGFRGRGLLARFLYALPESKMGYRDLEPRSVPEHVIERYAEGIRTLLEIEPRYDEQRHERIPHVLSLDGDAYGLWKAHQRRVEVELRDDGRFCGMTDWAGKLPGAVARLASLMHCARHALFGDGPIDRLIEAATMRQAVALGDLLAEHALVVFDLMNDNSVLESARQAWRHITSNGMATFTFSELWHPLRGTFKLTEDFEPVVETLQDHCLLLSDDAPQPGRRGRRGRRFRVNPKALAEVNP